jgi:hypothetical protein
VPVNPAASVRGLRHLMRSGKTVGLEGILEQFSSREGDSLTLRRFSGSDSADLCRDKVLLIVTH